MVEQKKADIVWNDRNLTEAKDAKPTLRELEDNQNRAKNHSFHLKSERKRSTIKPIIFAGFSALTIGAILGILLLSMFTHLPNKHEPIQTAISGNASGNTNNAQSSIQKDVYTLPDLQAHVLQGGMFGEESNVKEWHKIYEDADIPTYIWQESDNYYLFFGLFATKDVAKKAVIKNKEAGFDIFVKVWETGGQDVELTAQEHEWLLSMVTQWEASLKSLTNKGDFQLSVWKNLLAKTPPDMPHIHELVEHIEHLHSEKMTGANNREKQMVLLSIWYQYKSVSVD